MTSLTASKDRFYLKFQAVGGLAGSSPYDDQKGDRQAIYVKNVSL